MNIICRALTLDEFRRYARNYDFGKVKPNMLVIHHTWRPTKQEWKGERSIQGLKNYYEQKGWKAGPHIFCSDDAIWLFTPMNEIGIHAGSGNSTYKWGKLIGYSIGIEVVGDYDVEHWTGKTYENAIGVIKELMSLLNVPTEDVRFHRDFNPGKSCPGHAITKEWLFQELAKIDTEGKPIHPPTEVSPWALDGWLWQKELGLD